LTASTPALKTSSLTALAIRRRTRLARESAEVGRHLGRSHRLRTARFGLEDSSQDIARIDRVERRFRLDHVDPELLIP
jgi:hypothetical protein